MFGFVVGTACLAGLVHMLHHHGVFGHHRCGSWRDSGWRGGSCSRSGFGSRTLLRGLFSRLETSPSQEKVIIEAVEQFHDSARQAHRDMGSARGAIADAVRHDPIDDGALSAAKSAAAAALDKTLHAAEQALKSIHAALDERQRRALADLIDCGPFHSCWAGHPYRCAS